MSIVDWNFWHWLTVVQHELLLFAGVFFLIGALDDLAIDFAWVWLKLTGRAETPVVSRAQLQSRAPDGRAAVFIPAWQEADVIGDTIAHMLAVWPQEELRLYVGLYRNDPATLEAAMRGARGDARLRLVVHDKAGPTTKADCLNRLYDALRDDERRLGKPFSCVMFHDAEDMVDPAGLGLLTSAIEDGVDFAQLPVEPLPQRGRDWLGSHYCEEFAEAHGKAMVVRSALGAALPAAGVGCGVSRKALQQLSRRRFDRRPFEPNSLTEDYELGLAVAEGGGNCRFVRARAEDDLLIATRAYFPTALNTIVRQKTRWVHGIALQGWDRTGWGKGALEAWMRVRDRRGPLTALVLGLGYALVALIAVTGIAAAFGWAQPAPISPLLKALLIANFAMFVWRSAWRFGFTARNYGWYEGLWAVARIPVSNVVAIMAGHRAISAYTGTLLGRGIEWDKTSHSNHPSLAGGSLSSLPNPASPLGVVKVGGAQSTIGQLT